MGSPRCNQHTPWRSFDPPWPLVFAFIAEHPDGATLKEVGDVLGVSRERIRQIQDRALQKLEGRV